MQNHFVETQGWSVAKQQQPHLGLRRKAIQRLIAESDGKLMRGDDPRLTKREVSRHA